MKNTLFIRILVTFLYCTCIACKKEKSISGIKPDQGKPNIILILADDIGYEVPSYTGGQSYETVNIDFMANNGIQFCEARATPLCSPSRVEFFTGKYNFRNYVDWGKLRVSNYTIGNLMNDAGYNTCISGKWQLDGGDASIKSFGFDHYLVWNSFDDGESTETIGSHYKNPVLYANGQTVSFNNNEYGEDLHRNYLFDFIDSSVLRQTPFFGVWTPNLGHSPFKPTPDDPEYVNVSSGSNPKFFPSMIKYLDKEIGMLLAHLDSMNVSENTYIIFTADNGTDGKIVSTWKGQKITGGKNETLYSWGTHVPFIVYKKNGTVVKVDSSIIDFSDILVTLSDMTGKSLPSADIFDGVSFWPQIQGQENPSARTWSFTEFRPQPFTEASNLSRWVEDKMYKLYDSSFSPERKNQLYKTGSDTLELYPVTTFSPYELQKKATFLEVLREKKN